MTNILWLTKRRYMNKDVYADRFGRYYELPLRLSQLGARVHMLLLAYRGEPSCLVETNADLTWESVGVKHGLRYLSRARKLLSSNRFDIVVGSSDIPYCISAVLLGHKFRIPVICDIYDNFETYLSGRLPGVARLYYRMLAKSEAVITFNEALAAYLREKTGRTEVDVIHHSVDPACFRKLDKHECRVRLGLPADGILVGYFGAISRSRGISTLFRAFDMLEADGVEAKLVLGGKKDSGIDLNQPRYIYLGELPQAQVPIGINACDVNTVCYKDDAFARYSFPFKALEYMACERPLLTPRIGGIVDYLKDFPHFLYRVDDVSELAEKLKYLMVHPVARLPKVLTWDDAAAKFLGVLKDSTL